MSRGLAYSNLTPTEALRAVTGGSSNGFLQICVQRANASEVLCRVPIQRLFHTAWAKSCRVAPSKYAVSCVAFSESCGQDVPKS